MRTNEAAKRQMNAMGSEFFEVGILGETMLNRVWDEESLNRSMPWLKHRNVHGDHIYIRPSGEHNLSLIDDLSAQSITEMIKTGYQPSVVVETSPHNFQAWLNHGATLDKEHSTMAAQALARRFNGDTKAADWRHYGRLAGFTNRKERYMDDSGRFPFVKLHVSEARTYDQAQAFTDLIHASVLDRRAASERNQQLWKERTPDQIHALKTIEHFRRDPRYDNDLHRADAAYAVYAQTHGIPRATIAAALASRDLSKKGNERQQQAYIERTIERAASRGR
jgi:hypothetical protein